MPLTLRESGLTRFAPMLSVRIAATTSNGQ
jgi:hypothetical protein